MIQRALTVRRVIRERNPKEENSKTQQRNLRLNVLLLYRTQ